MKTLHLIFLLAALAATPCAGFGQNQTKLARIHLYSPSPWGIGRSFKLQPLPQNSEPISISRNQYILLESSMDSLGFVSGGKTMYLRFELGKSYYLRITPAFYGGGINQRVLKTIAEVTEREFKWTLLINDHSDVADKIYKF